MSGTTKNGYLVEHGTDNPYAPKTKTSLVDDIAKGHALSQTLINTPDREALGYAPFSTVTAYTAGQIVYYNNKLWKFTAAHAAGAWTGEDVEQFNIKEALEDADATFKSGEKVKDVSLENYAKIDSNYPAMTVGKATNFTGEPIPVTTGYTLKATGYDPSQPELEFADGIVNMTEIQGRACAWNQLVNNGDFSNGIEDWEAFRATFSFSNGVATITPTVGDNSSGLASPTSTIKWVDGHKYFVLSRVKGSIGNTMYFSGFYGPITDDTPKFSPSGEWETMAQILTVKSDASNYDCLRIGINQDSDANLRTYQTRGVYAIDLTLLNPTLAEEVSNDATGIAKVEAYLASIRTPKPYYAQNAGTLLGAKMNGWQLHKTANLLNPTTKQAKLFSYAYTGHDNEYTVNGLPSDAAVKFVEDSIGDNLPTVTNLVTNGDFSDGTTEWYTSGCTMEVSNGIATLTQTSASGVSFDMWQTGRAVVSGHKYLFKMLVKGNNTFGLRVTNIGSQSGISGGVWQSVGLIGNGNSTMDIYFDLTGMGNVFEVKAISLTDLTATFGEGNEPATVAEAELALFGIVTPDANNHFVIPSQGVASIINAGSLQPYDGDLTRTSIIATWDESMDDVYSAYEEDNIEIDSANIYYDNNGVKTQVFDGGILRSTGDGANNVRDRVYFDEIAKKWVAEVKVGDQDLGKAAVWGLTEQGYFDYGPFPSDSADAGYYNVQNWICGIYKVIRGYDVVRNNEDMCVGSHSGPRLIIRDSSCANATALINKLQGVHLWYELATHITHDTLYYKVGNDYLPMEEVFPNGIQGYCCNWASESLVEQAEVDGQPQSITPVTTEVFQSDYKELLKTIGDTYIQKLQVKASFQNLATAIQSLGTLVVGDFDSNGVLTFSFTPAS